jgi:biofilm PGA synthesis protein PgaD
MKPIIIERPELQSPLQRATTRGLTLVFWVIWIYLWLPVISLVAWLAGIELFREYMIDNDGYKILFDDINWYVIIIVLIGVIFIGWARYNLLRFRDKESRKNPVIVDLAAHAQHFKIDPQQLKQWQTAKHLVIHHDKHGDITRVDANESTADLGEYKGE